MASRDIKITIIGDASKAQKAFNEAGTAAGTFETKVEGLGSKFGTFAGTMSGVVAGGALASLPGLLMDGAKGATEDAAAMDKLKQAVINSGSSWDDYSSTIDDAIKKGQDLAFTDGETATALATLTALTGDSDEALRRLTSAQNLARGAGISLEEAAKLLGKTSDENTAALSRMGIQLGENATAQDVLNAVDQKFAGQAGTFAEGDAGKLLKAQQASGELAETFGSFLIPAMLLAAQTATLIGNVLATYVAPAIQAVIGVVVPLATTIGSFVADNAGPFLAALTGIGAAVLAIVIPAMVAWVAGTIPVIAAHVTMAAAVIAAYAPIILIVAAVGAAAAALYVAWDKNLFGIRDITQQVLDFVRPYFETAIGAIRTVVEVAFPIIAQVVTTYINILKAEIEIALGIVQAVWNTVFPAIQAVVETVFPIIAQLATTYIGILKTEVELGIAAAKWAFDNVFVPIQGIVSDVFSTIAGIVTTVWGPTVTAIGVGVDTVKTIFDGLVYIQGIVSDVFETISGLVQSLWNSGAVLLIASGLGTIKSLFSGIYTTMYGFGSDIVQGLLDGVSSLLGRLRDLVGEIGDLLVIDVPGFSPPYSAGFKQGRAFVSGLSDGMEAGYSRFDRTLADISDGFAGAAFNAAVTSGPVITSGPGHRTVSFRRKTLSPYGEMMNREAERRIDAQMAGAPITSNMAAGGTALNPSEVRRLEDAIVRAVETGIRRGLAGV